MIDRRTIRKNQPQDEQFMKISDYSEGKSSNHNNSEVEEYPIEEFQNYINKKGKKIKDPEEVYE